MKNLIAKQYIFVELLIVVLFLTSCIPPYKVRNIAISAIKDMQGRSDSSTEFQNAWEIRNSSISDFDVVRAERRAITKAEKLNGLSAQWCLIINFVEFRNFKYSDLGAMAIVKKENGQWSAYIVAREYVSASTDYYVFNYEKFTSMEPEHYYNLLYWDECTGK